MLNAGLGWLQSANEIKFIMARRCKNSNLQASHQCRHKTLQKIIFLPLTVLSPQNPPNKARSSVLISVTGINYTGGVVTSMPREGVQKNLCHAAASGRTPMPRGGLRPHPMPRGGLRPPKTFATCGLRPQNLCHERPSAAKPLPRAAFGRTYATWRPATEIMSLS